MNYYNERLGRKIIKKENYLYKKSKVDPSAPFPIRSEHTGLGGRQRRIVILKLASQGS